MIDMRKTVYDAIHTVTMEDPLYDCLPRLVDGEQDVIYTIQRIPPRSHTEIIDRRTVTVEDSAAKLRIFLIFDINNQLVQDCITKGRCKIHKYDTLVVVGMDENYHMDASVEFYLDLIHPIQPYTVNTEFLTGRGYGNAITTMTFLSYDTMLNMNMTTPKIDKEITDIKLLGGTIKEEVTHYDAYNKKKTVTLVDKEVTGLLSKIDDRLIHYGK